MQVLTQEYDNGFRKKRFDAIVLNEMLIFFVFELSFIYFKVCNKAHLVCPL